MEAPSGGGIAGLTVGSVEQAVAAPYLSSRLADPGARVIEVGRPEGDFARGDDHLVHGQESAYSVWLNRGKQSLCLDLKRAGDAAVLRALVAETSIFIQNLTPRAIDRIGFHPSGRSAGHIAVSISGYGETGPCRDLGRGPHGRGPGRVILRDLVRSEARRGAQMRVSVGEG